jgi:hypothetical protein
MQGFARCVQHGCERFQDDREIPIVIDLVEERDPQKAGMVISSTEYVIPVDDADLACPDCGQPCALTTGPAKTYARMVM